MHWQGKSVQFEGLALVPAKITSISAKRDRTRLLERLAEAVSNEARNDFQAPSGTSGVRPVNGRSG